ncbi:MAG: hypothetical protein JRI68_16760 [Deltaproteobacteria bacterium]|nr:hypothetical protein [Deltaproteobacteria bacterium]
MIRLWVLPEHRLVVRQLCGEVTLEEALETAFEALEHPDYQTGFVTLQDHRRAHFDLSGVELAELAKQLQPRIKTIGRMAMVVNNPLAWGITRMAAVFLRPLGAEIRPCHTVREAKEWLGLPASLRLPFESDSDRKAEGQPVAG